MKIPLSAAIAGAALSALVARPSAPQEAAPYVTSGAAIYALVASDPTTRASLPEVGPTEPIKVVGVRGTWVLVEVRGQTRGPVWLNFDQVVSYRTNP